MIDRRRFLRLAGASVGAAVAAACAGPASGPGEARAPSPTERFTRRTLARLEGFSRWLDGAPGLVGEVGWPRSGPDAQRWDALGRRWLEAAAGHGLWVTYWASGPWPPEYPLTAHEGGPLHTTHAPGVALTEAAGPYPECNGVNLAGWEWADDNAPSAASFRYLAERDITLVRVPFAWERVQPEPGGELSDAGASRMSAVCDAAQEAGCRVIWDCHNYEEVHHWSGGSPRLMTTSEFVDLWGRLSEVLRGHPAVAGYGLMNEPNPHTGSDPGGWQERSQACVDALRERGDDQRVFVATFHWSNISRTSEQHPDGPWIDDPAGATWYEAHHYFDHDETGSYAERYDVEVARAVAGT